jgi:hypothetical protein
MIAGCIYGSIDLQKCFGCPMCSECETRKNFMPRNRDRGPDASTSDFLLCRGEFDSHNKIRRVEIIKASVSYRNHIEQERKALGLDNPGGRSGC